MCRMCESENYDTLLELQARYYYLNKPGAPPVSPPASLISPKFSIPTTQFPREESWNLDQYRRGSLSTCFSNLNIQRDKSPLLPNYSRRTSAVNIPSSNAQSHMANILSPPSSPKTASLSLPLMKVMEVEEHESITQVDGDEQREVDAEPCRRFQRQILSRLQVLNSQPQDPSMLMVMDPDASVNNNTHRFTPPPSPDLYDHKQGRINHNNRLRPLASSSPSSRKGSATITPRPNKIRLPSLAELEWGVLAVDPISPRFTACTITSSGRRRVSSPGPSSHVGSRGGIKKLGCVKKNGVEVLGDNTPFKAGWSFSTAYGKAK